MCVAGRCCLLYKQKPNDMLCLVFFLRLVWKERALSQHWKLFSGSKDSSQTVSTRLCTGWMDKFLIVSPRSWWTTLAIPKMTNMNRYVFLRCPFSLREAYHLAVRHSSLSLEDMKVLSTWILLSIRCLCGTKNQCPLWVRASWKFSGNKIDLKYFSEMFTSVQLQTWVWIHTSLSPSREPLGKLLDITCDWPIPRSTGY